MKKLITVFVCLIVLGITTSSFANTSKMDLNSQITLSLLNQNAKLLTNFNVSDPPFPAYVIAYTWSGSTFTYYFVFATSWTDYTLVSGYLGFETTGTITLNNTVYSFSPYNGGNVYFSNGIETGSLAPSTIDNIDISAVSPSTYNGYQVITDNLGANYNP